HRAGRFCARNGEAAGTAGPGRWSRAGPATRGRARAWLRSLYEGDVQRSEFLDVGVRAVHGARLEPRASARAHSERLVRVVGKLSPAHRSLQAPGDRLPAFHGFSPSSQLEALTLNRKRVLLMADNISLTNAQLRRLLSRFAAELDAKGGKMSESEIEQVATRL